MIIAIDAEADPSMQFHGLKRAVRLCERQHHARIEIDTSPIVPHSESRLSDSHFSVGRILYRDGAVGTLLYVKASLVPDDRRELLQLREVTNVFPHDSTVNQFFDEDLFDAYRDLGMVCMERAISGLDPNASIERLCTALHDAAPPSRAVLGSATRALEQVLAAHAAGTRGGFPPPVPYWEESPADLSSPSQVRPLSRDALFVTTQLYLLQQVFHTATPEGRRHLSKHSLVSTLLRAYRAIPAFMDVWNVDCASLDPAFRRFVEQTLGFKLAERASSGDVVPTIPA